MVYGAKPLGGPATLADIETLPEGVVGEIIDGTLYTHARPRAAHGHFEYRLHRELDDAFQPGGEEMPGGWWIMSEPGIRVGGSPEFIPDLAGWRRERVPLMPQGQWTDVPDWACEILSPSTRAYDTRIKRPFYARIGIQHLWFVDLDARTLTVSKLHDGHWLEVGVYGEEDDLIRAPPFEERDLRLGWLWKSIPPAG
ncbi:Uma2 family endonuclease [Corallococcus carmarthensis]|uniref:Uma2 family endonuclease n=1 Tax=Corallococcus carmarthensis TaxID=2316728 RepID=A0A3A8JWN3_9BACT|nr:Uma2 family endonuclease [Corallococcus carmarthensis]NOK20747.1 Uma2 family endonuclease [Corallococcus carmarthensis]RKG96190.1 Uma2 family endonuclease [Corallococcus carmarthensis]